MLVTGGAPRRVNRKSHQPVAKKKKKENLNLQRNLLRERNAP